MEKHCQNPLCDNEAVTEVSMAVSESSDQKRALCAACHEAYRWGVQHGRTLQKGLLLEPPPEEGGPEPLYRVVYMIDVNAADARSAGQCAHEIMRDPQSMRPVLDVIASNACRIRIDLSQRQPARQ